MEGLLIVLLILLVVMVGGGIAMYNGLVKLRTETDNAWSQIDVQLKRRYDLIPNLVESVKGMMSHERETLERVIQARNQAIGARNVKEAADGEAAVASALNGFFGLQESYPELKANENMSQLMEELRSTENKVSFARQYYNDVVTRYNTKLETFPSNLMAGMGDFPKKDLFEIADPAQREAVQVSFD